MHSLTSVGCRLAVAGQTQTFKRFLLALGHTYIRTAVACSSAVQQQPLAALLHICTFLIPSKAQSLPFISAFHHDTSLLFVIVMLALVTKLCPCVQSHHTRPHILHAVCIGHHQLYSLSLLV
jgi:hypothetical protein